MQYNRSGITDIQQIRIKPKAQKTAAGRNIASLIRLFLVIMVFVVIVLTIAR